MALNIKLRATAQLVQVATNVATHGNFAMVGNRFYYAYVDQFGQGRVRLSIDTGRSWVDYDHLGAVENISARGNLIAWTQGKIGVVYDILQQWEVARGYPFNPDSYSSLGRMVPLPEIGAVQLQRNPTTGAANAGGMKRIAEFGIWDAPAQTVNTGTGGFTVTYRDFLGVHGDQLRQGSGIDRIYDSYLVESYYLGSPSQSYTAVTPREDVTDGSVSSDNASPWGEYLNSPFRTRGMEGSRDGISGVISSQRRGPPGLGTHNRGIPASIYTIRMDGQQVGLRSVNDIYSSSNFSWAHGGAWVDEYNLVAASGAIGGHHGVVFRDAAGNIVMVKRSGSQFGEWSEAKSYGNPGFSPQTLWLPYTYATVRAGIYGQGEAWMLIDDAPDFIPRGRLVEGDYLAQDPPESKVETTFRKVTFW